MCKQKSNCVYLSIQLSIFILIEISTLHQQFQFCDTFTGTFYGEIVLPLPTFYMFRAELFFNYSEQFKKNLSTVC